MVHCLAGAHRAGTTGLGGSCFALLACFHVLSLELLVCHSRCFHAGPCCYSSDAVLFAGTHHGLSLAFLVCAVVSCFHPAGCMSLMYFAGLPRDEAIQTAKSLQRAFGEGTDQRYETEMERRDRTWRAHKTRMRARSKHRG